MKSLTLGALSPDQRLNQATNLAEDREILERPGAEVFGIDEQTVRPLFADYTARFTDRGAGRG